MDKNFMNQLDIVRPDWPAPSSIIALTTTRKGGVSEGTYASFNLGHHVGDNPAHVDQNRQRLLNALDLSHEPIWLNQTHSNIIVNLDNHDVTQLSANPPTADGCYTVQPQQICAVLTADCLPVLLCNRAGTEVAAVHAGWRGCLSGILSEAIKNFRSPPSDIIAWLGPAIGPEAFEVGPEVFEAFTTQQPINAPAFIPQNNGKYLANLYLLATLSLNQEGVTAVYGGDYCTYTDDKMFFSYRKAGGSTGRMASIILIANSVEKRQ